MARPRGISIAICTHNRATILAQTLASLARVEPEEAVEVELVVIANKCTDDTVSVAHAHAPRLWMPTRVVEEPTPGISHARNRAVREARHEVIAFLDDDVLLAPRWLRALVNAYDEHAADMVGGRVELWWDAVRRPDWFQDRWNFMLSAVDHGDAVRVLDRPDIAGANFSMRREVFDRVGPFRTDLGRIGKRLLAGEESHIVGAGIASGYRLVYAPESSLRHWVHPNRADPQYLLGIARWGAYSLVLMRPRLTPGYALRTLAGGTARVVLGGVGRVVAALSRNPGARVAHAIDFASGIGQLHGVAARLTRSHTPGPAAG